jgi:hypothetical protein
MRRSEFVKAAAGPRRQPGALPSSALPGFVDAAPSQTLHAHQPVQQGRSSALGVSANPGDLVARALAILAEEAEVSRGFAPRSIR